MTKEYKKIKKISKKIISKNQYKKIKKLNGHKERTEGLKYLIVSKMKLKLLELELKSKRFIEEDQLLLKAKINLLASKIKIFESTYAEHDNKMVQKLIKEIEGDINV